MDSISLVAVKRDLKKNIGISFPLAHFYDPAVFVKANTWLLSQVLPIMQNTI